MNNILIIGAGGVASYLFPVLVKSFKLESIDLMDKDVLEERNLDRQAFDKRTIGMCKAEALLASNKWLKHYDVECHFIDTWFTASTDISKYDLVICCADNHVARKGALAACDQYNKICVIAGNEYFDCEAYIYYPDHDQDLSSDPRIKFPEILTDESGNPVRCQGEEQEAHPQLAIANMGAAHKILHLLWNHVHSKADINNQPYYLKSTQYVLQATKRD